MSLYPMLTLIDYKPNFKIVYDVDEKGFDFFREKINCDLIEFASMEKGIEAIIDEEGLLKSGNPIFSIMDNGKIKHFGGRIVFTKSEFNHVTGLVTKGFKNKDEIMDFLKDIKVELIGFVK